MIAVTGANGQLGSLVIQALMNTVPAGEIVAIVRDTAKAEKLRASGVQVRQGDYGQADSLGSALEGIDKLLLISSSEVGQRLEQHRNVIEAAKKAGVALLAYTSILHADTSPLLLAKEHVETERLIRDSGIPFTFLRNGWYIENYFPAISTALETGKVLGAAGDAKFSAASRADFAAAAAAVLTTKEQEGQIHELGGDQAFTLSELAASVSELSGKSVSYVNFSEPDYKNMLISFGVPPGFAHMLAQSDSGAAQGGLYEPGRQLSRLIQRPTTALQTVLKAYLSSQT
ncbi:SDR family oxidoreductase [Undibacterium sp. TS12]|uniref:SDR family oxidoreductase n=1 Tax=Undibacterium sp. TS12 TaxID=2908202 RepID=UPI001F4CFAA6|nr:SDR family oxidoreductase [Undibacterium sp. TS12]MCH8620864.1 SDR family oxidoreductase [Undibacterium sp. TS12]